MEPLVSILIPTHNRTELALKAIRSALTQSYAHLEIIVSDNSRTDILGQKIEGIKDRRIKYSRNPDNIGPILNWRKALHNSTGKYCLILPDDDYLLNPYYIEDAVNILQAERVALVIPECICKYPTRNILGSTGHMGVISGQEFLQREHHIPHIGNMFIRAQAIELDAFNCNAILWSDIELWWRILKHNDAYCYEVPSFLYLFHNDNIVLNMSKQQLVLNSQFVGRSFDQAGEGVSVDDMLLRYLKMVHSICGSVDREFVDATIELNKLKYRSAYIHYRFCIYRAKNNINRTLRRLLHIVRRG